jgi:hypothetical protein
MHVCPKRGKRQREKNSALHLNPRDRFMLCLDRSSRGTIPSPLFGKHVGHELSINAALEFQITLLIGRSRTMCTSLTLKLHGVLLSFNYVFVMRYARILCQMIPPDVRFAYHPCHVSQDFHAFCPIQFYFYSNSCPCLQTPCILGIFLPQVRAKGKNAIIYAPI